MQEKIEQKSEFSERTERLAAHLDLRLSKLPAILGISPAMFFAYRTGKRRISEKAWRKLEDAEVAAGIGRNRAVRGVFGGRPQDGNAPHDVAEYLRAEAQRHLEMAQKLLSAALLIEREKSE